MPSRRVREAFAHTAKAGRAAFLPYVTLGDPSPELSSEIVLALARGGADFVELGIPYSDPLADGPVIQAAAQRALQAGFRLGHTWDVIRRIRHGEAEGRGGRHPLGLGIMTYVNPVLQFGVQRFAATAAQAGADALLVPDVPFEEADELLAACQAADLALVPFLAPTSTAERVRAGVQRGSGFIYCVSVTGVTGARERLAADLPAFLERVRAQTELPLAVGFGVSSPEQAAQVGRLAEGVIVGTAVVQALQAAGAEAPAAAERLAAAYVAAMAREA